MFSLLLIRSLICLAACVSALHSFFQASHYQIQQLLRLSETWFKKFSFDLFIRKSKNFCFHLPLSFSVLTFKPDRRFVPLPVLFVSYLYFIYQLSSLPHHPMLPVAFFHWLGSDNDRKKTSLINYKRICKLDR